MTSFYYIQMTVINMYTNMIAKKKYVYKQCKGTYVGWSSCLLVGSESKQKRSRLTKQSLSGFWNGIPRERYTGERPVRTQLGSEQANADHHDRPPPAMPVIDYDLLCRLVEEGRHQDVLAFSVINLFHQFPLCIFFKKNLFRLFGPYQDSAPAQVFDRFLDIEIDLKVKTRQFQICTSHLQKRIFTTIDGCRYCSMLLHM